MITHKYVFTLSYSESHVFNYRPNAIQNVHWPEKGEKKWTYFILNFDQMDM